MASHVKIFDFVYDRQLGKNFVDFNYDRLLYSNSMIINEIVDQEKIFLKNFFNQDFSIFLPETSQQDLEKLDKFGFDLHFLPLIKMGEKEQFPGWQKKPSKNFYYLIKKEKLSENSDFLLGKWIFIEKRKKPEKNCWWISKDDIWVKILKKFKINLKKYCQKINRQQYKNDFLLPLLKENGFSSRFSLSWQEIEEIIKPEIAKLLKIPLEKIRLPRFIEWNFLANVFYPEWEKTSTWEWLADRLPTGECLSGGSNSLGIVGWDPPDYWSTILGFRILVEV